MNLVSEIVKHNDNGNIRFNVVVAYEAIKTKEFVELSRIVLRVSLPRLLNSGVPWTTQRSPARWVVGTQKNVKDACYRNIVGPTSRTHTRDNMWLSGRKRTTNRSTTATTSTGVVVVVVVVVVRSVARTRRDILRFVRDLYNCTVCLGQGAGRHVYSILSISDRCTPFRLHEFSRAPSGDSQAATCLSSCLDRYRGASR